MAGERSPCGTPDMAGTRRTWQVSMAAARLEQRECLLGIATASAGGECSAEQLEPTFGMRSRRDTLECLLQELPY